MSTHEPNKVMETENQLLYWEKKESENTPKKFMIYSVYDASFVNLSPFYQLLL